MYDRCREKGVTIDHLSYGHLQKYKQKVFQLKQNEEKVNLEYKKKMERQEKF